MTRGLSARVQVVSLFDCFWQSPCLLLEGAAPLSGLAALLLLVYDKTTATAAPPAGAVYLWDLGTGTRLTELEYVDKKCLYCSGDLQQAMQCISRNCPMHVLVITSVLATKQRHVSRQVGQHFRQQHRE